MAQGLEHLLRAGNRVSANMTLSLFNIDRIEETAEIARSMGFYGMGFQGSFPVEEGNPFLIIFSHPKKSNPLINGFIHSIGQHLKSSQETLWQVPFQILNRPQIVASPFPAAAPGSQA